MNTALIHHLCLSYESTHNPLMKAQIKKLIRAEAGDTKTILTEGVKNLIEGKSKVESIKDIKSYFNVSLKDAVDIYNANI